MAKEVLIGAFVLHHAGVAGGEKDGKSPGNPAVLPGPADLLDDVLVGILEDRHPLGVRPAGHEQTEGMT